MSKMIDLYVESRDVSENHKVNLNRVLTNIFRNLEDNYDVKVEDYRIENLDGTTLQIWFNAEKKRLKPGSLNNEIVILNPFLRWACTMTKNGVPYLDDDKAPNVLHTVKLPDADELPEWERPKDKYLDHDSARQLLNDSSRNCLRNNAIVALFLYSGLRVSELCSLTLGSVLDRKHNEIYVKRKGGKWCTAYLAEDAYPYLEAYLSTRKDVDDHSRPLFLTEDGNPCNRIQIYKMVSAKQKKLGVATGPHALRHTFVSEVEKCGGASVARDLANHKSLVITNRYDHTTPEQRKNAVNNLHW